VHRPTVSLILPTSITTTSSNEQMTSLDTILSIDDTKQSSSSVELVEQEKKDLVVNKYKQSFQKGENLLNKNFLYIGIIVLYPKRKINLVSVGQYVN
jgi:hypothetical protein